MQASQVVPKVKRFYTSECSHHQDSKTASVSREGYELIVVKCDYRRIKMPSADEVWSGRYLLLPASYLPYVTKIQSGAIVFLSLPLPP